MSKSHLAQKLRRISSLQMASTSIANTSERKKPNLFQMFYNALSAKSLDTIFMNAMSQNPNA